VPENVSADSGDERRTPGTRGPEVVHYTKWNPKDGQECSAGHEIAVYVVEIKFLDQAIAPSTRPMLHFKQQGLHDVAHPVAMVSWKLYTADSLMSGAAELRECATEGNAFKVLPKDCASR
jgi:hypothetical protein